jgi:mersacidin/lichenicidin family type 2 lantibiotic
MSTEEIIQSWKNKSLPSKKPVRAFHSSQKPEAEPGKAPANPIGEQELSDEELALIEGGSGVCTCTREDSCIPHIA